jgi:hypothetical protein
LGIANDPPLCRDRAVIDPPQGRAGDNLPTYVDKAAIARLKLQGVRVVVEDFVGTAVELPLDEIRTPLWVFADVKAAICPGADNSAARGVDDPLLMHRPSPRGELNNAAVPLVVAFDFDAEPWIAFGMDRPVLVAVHLKMGESFRAIGDDSISENARVWQIPKSTGHVTSHDRRHPGTRPALSHLGEVRFCVRSGQEAAMTCLDLTLPVTVVTAMR